MNLLRDLVSSWREKANAMKRLEDVLAGQLRAMDLFSPYGRTPKTDKANQLEQYKSWAYTCANRNAAAIAGVPLRLFATRGTGDQKFRAKCRIATPEQIKHLRGIKSVVESARFKSAQEVVEIETHPILDLLSQVNPFHNQYDLMERLSLFLDLTGDAYWHIVDGPLGIPSEIWTLPSQHIRIIPSKDKFIAGYVFGIDPSNQVKFGPEAVIHFLLSNPKDLYYGISRIEGAYLAITGYLSMEQYEKDLTDLRGMKDVLIKYKGGTLTAKQRRDLMNEWSNAIKAGALAKAPMIADQDIDIQEATWAPRELGFLQGRQWRKEEIINAFGQHSAMYDKNANTANINGAIYLWEEYEITPSLRRIEQKLNEQLVPRYNEPRIFVAFDPILSEDRESVRLDDTMLLSNGYPINRILQRRGLAPIPGGDVGYIQSIMVPLGTPPQLPQTNSPKHRSYKSRDIVLLATDSERVPGNHEAGCQCCSCNDLHIKQDGSADVDRTGGRNPPLSANERKIKRGVSNVLKKQEPEAIKEVERLQAAGFEFAMSEKATTELIGSTISGIELEVLKGGRKGAAKIGIRIGDFVDRSNVQSAIRSHTFKFAQAFGDETVKLLKEQMVQGIAAGESIPELKKRIASNFDQWQKYRAERVARTESARAIETGQITAWRESGVVVGKQWDSMSDACPFCLDMSGKIIELEESYFTTDGPGQEVEFGGRTINLRHNYLDVDGPPLHCGCRCDLEPVLIGE